MDVSFTPASTKAAAIEMDRKVLSDLAVHEPAAFKSLVEQAQSALAKAGA